LLAAPVPAGGDAWPIASHESLCRFCQIDMINHKSLLCPMPRMERAVFGGTLGNTTKVGRSFTCLPWRTTASLPSGCRWGIEQRG
jgi:hypothetical protein